MFKTAALLVAIAIPALCSPMALAWGPEGHAIIAEIAESRLTPAAAKQVHELLAIDGHTHLDDIASWADAYRHDHPETGPWHFVNIPLDAAAYDASRDCPDDDCIVAKIPYFARILTSASSSQQDKLTALLFETHFLGDMHQPLHDEDSGDRGGNEVKLTFDQRKTNLHAIWDGGIIEKVLDVRLGPNFTPDFQATKREAALEEKAISAAAAAEWAPSDALKNIDTLTVSWVNEAHGIAISAYRYLPSEETARWDDVYETQEWPVVQLQLERAGVRLAELLNEAFQ